jgi:hypothetical protein
MGGDADKADALCQFVLGPNPDSAYAGFFLVLTGAFGSDKLQ